jgi:hypothetical protein
MTFHRTSPAGLRHAADAVALVLLTPGRLAFLGLTR